MDLYNLVLSAKLSKGGGSEPVIESLSVTENGTYEAPSGVDGYSPVTVNVPGITPTGTISITQNGTVDVTQYASANVNVSGGGGASNLVHGEFTFDTEGVHAISVPYSGNGYPLCAIVCPKGGTRANTTWKDTIRKYAVGEYALVKTDLLTEPTFVAGLSQNEATAMNIYKNSTSSASSKTAGWTSNYLLSNSDAQNTSGMMFKFKGDAKTLSVYVVGTSGTDYGFLVGITYEYFIVYSS